VNVIQKFVAVLGVDFLNMMLNTIFDLISIPKHYTILGVDCETYASSSPSIFKHDPRNITVFLLKMVHLPVDTIIHAPMVPQFAFQSESRDTKLVLQGEPDHDRQFGQQKRNDHDEVPDADEALTLEFLREVFERMRVGSTPEKPYIPLSEKRKHLVNILSTRQLFLGVYDSPNRDSLIRSKHEMSGSFGRSVIEERLKTFYECGPNLGTLRELATRVARRAEIPPSAERTRAGAIEWSEVHWDIVEPFLGTQPT
jgi:hypothetical protein